jgi:hypothetical protein
MEMLQMVLKTSATCLSKAELTELVLTQLELLSLQHSALHSEYSALYKRTSRCSKDTKDFLTEMLANLLIWRLQLSLEAGLVVC